jgi:hypothetical protein
LPSPAPVPKPAAGLQFASPRTIASATSPAASNSQPLPSLQACAAFMRGRKLRGAAAARGSWRREGRRRCWKGRAAVRGGATFHQL